MTFLSLVPHPAPCVDPASLMRAAITQLGATLNPLRLQRRRTALQHLMGLPQVTFFAASERLHTDQMSPDVAATTLIAWLLARCDNPREVLLAAEHAHRELSSTALDLPRAS